MSGGEEGKIRRWRVEDGKEAGTPMNAGSAVWDMAASQDGKWIVAGTDSGQVTVWNAESRKKATEFKAHRLAVHAVDISPDGTKIATGSDDTTVCVWSRSTGQQLLGPLSYGFIDSVVAVKLSPDGRLVAAAVLCRGSVRVWDTHGDGRLIVDCPISISWVQNASLAWTNDSKQLFILSDDDYVNCLDVYVGKALHKWLIHSNGRAWSIALACNGSFLVVSHQSSVSFWDTRTYKQIGSPVSHTFTREITSMVISPNFGIGVCGDKKIIVLPGLLDAFPSLYFDKCDAHSSAHFDNVCIFQDA